MSQHPHDHAQQARRGGAGECHLDGQAAIGPRAGGDAGLVRVGDRLDDGQAQAQSLVADAVGGQPLERLEEPVDGGGRDLGSGVGDGKDRAVFPALGGDVDQATRTVVPQRIVDQVGDQLLGQLRTARGGCLAERVVERQVPLPGFGLAYGEDRAGQVGQVEGLPLVQAGLSARQREQCVDEPLLFGARCQDPFMGGAQGVDAGVRVGQGDLADDTLAGQRGA